MLWSNLCLDNSLGFSQWLQMTRKTRVGQIKAQHLVIYGSLKAQLDYHQAVSKNAVMEPFLGNLYANHPFKLTESGS